MKKLFSYLVVVFFAVLAFNSFDAMAAEGLAKPWQMGFQDAASPVAEKMNEFHNLLLYIIFAITAFVMVLLAYVMLRFNAKANPTPSKTTHNVMIEVIWTAIPVLILIVIAIPSFKLLYYQGSVPETEMSLKVTGHQWYWSYEYPDHGEISFESYMIPDDEIKEGQVRLLDVDNPVVLPINTKIKILVTSADVLHAWAIPAFGFKMDTVPGRLSEGWIYIDKAGTYYGQCSELCGVNHGFMPITVKAVTKEEFKAWVKKAKKKFSSNGFGTPAIAATPTQITVN